MNGTIISSLTGQQMADNPNRSGEWVKQYGVFKIAEQVGRIRLFLRSGCPKTSSSTGCVSRFRQLEVFLFGTEEEAKLFLKDYQ